MVCIYCSSATAVINSRAQKRLNQVWRRRSCGTCGAIFTSLEAPAYAQNMVVESHNQRPTPFLRDRLLVSIYDSCKHRSTAINDATALTSTIMSKLLRLGNQGILQREDIVRLTHATLKRFDKASAVYYAAYHLKEH